MQRIKIILLITLMGWSSPMISSEQNALQQANSSQYNIRKWSYRSGIPLNIYAICQTPDGFLWLGNEFGITRFDGINTLLFDRRNSKEMTEDFCLVLYLASDSTMYCGMSNGLVLQYKNSIFTAVGSKEVFQGKSIQAICEDHNGDIWIASGGIGLLKFSKGRFIQFNKNNGLPSNNVLSITRGAKNEMWIGTDGGLSRFKEGKFETFNTQNGLTSNVITAIALSDDNVLWAGSSDGNVIMFKDGKISSIINEPLGNSRSVSSINPGSDNIIWFGTQGDGLFGFDQQKKQILHITTNDSLSSNMVTSIMTNSEGDLMVATQGNGLNRLRKNIVQTYSRQDGLAENSVMGICKTKNGNILIGHEAGGITMYRNGKFTDLSSKFGIDNLPVFSIAEDTLNNIHVATVGSLVTWNGKNKTVFKAHSRLSNTLFKALYTDHKGIMWAGTDAGIYLFGGKDIKTISTNNGLSDGRIFCFLEDHIGRMWIGTQEGGINIIKDGKISSITKRDGLGDNMILSMYEDNEGTIWIGTGNHGLNRIDGKTGKISQLDSLNLKHPSICHITEDQMRNLWVGTTVGIFVVKKDEITGYISGLNKLPKVVCFGEEEGVTGACVGGVYPAGCTTPDKKLWFSMTEGIAEIDPQASSIQITSPVVSIDTVIVNNKVLERNDFYDLPPGIIHLQINYTAPSFIAPEKLTFRYKLEGYDTDWTEAGERRFAIYTKVPHGNYTFKVEVRNYQGIISEHQATVNIHVNPFFYQTWWFISLCLIFALALAYGIFAFRIRQIRDKELEILVVKRTDEIRKLNESLEQKVADRTAQLTASNLELEAFSYSVSHDLKAPVRRIDGLIQALVEDYSQVLDVTARDFLNKISESVSSMSVLIDELLKLSRIARQELEKSDINLTAIAEEICAKLQKGNPDRQVKIIIHEGMVVEADSRLVQIALQNLFDNAWKYTGKEEEAIIEFGMAEKDGKKTIFIRDNGAGFDMKQYGKLFTPFQRLHSDDQFTGTGIGLATVKRIILKHGGWIGAESETGKGAIFFFRFS